MKIQSVGVVNQSAPNIFANKKLNNLQTKKPTFGINLEAAISTTWKSVDEISSSLSKNYGMKTEFKRYDIAANMVEKTVRIFKSIFPVAFLPASVSLKFLDDEKDKNTLIRNEGQNIIINANQRRFLDFNVLEEQSKKEGPEKNIFKKAFNEFFDNEKVFLHSTTSILTSFVQSFVKCAHFVNVNKKHSDNWEKVQNVPLPMFNVLDYSVSTFGTNATQKNKTQDLMTEILTRQILEYPETIKYDSEYTLFNFPEIRSERAKKFFRDFWNGDFEEFEKTRTDLACIDYDDAETLRKIEENSRPTFWESFINDLCCSSGPP
ncbi:hypothetical protein J6Q66_07555 [bacterium]|nr:hypothetical protein [bacterium]